jgi:hypothetical protein
MTHPSSLLLHRLRYGELSPEESATVRAHVDTCPRCSSVLRTQQNHRAAFELAPIPEAIRQAAATPEPARPWSRWFVWGVALAAAVLLAVVGVQNLGPDDGVRTKGGSETFEVWRDTPEGAVAVGENDVVYTGDRIQARLKRPSAPWVTLAGKDARGEVEIYGTWAADMHTVDWQMAPFALELDDTPGDLSLWLMFTEARPADATVSAAIDGGPLPDGAELRTITLEKGL